MTTGAPVSSRSIHATTKSDMTAFSALTPAHVSKSWEVFPGAAGIVEGISVEPVFVRLSEVFAPLVLLATEAAQPRPLWFAP